MFNKDIYRKNREAGKRGQGEYPNPIVAIDSNPPTSLRGLGQRRKRKDRTLTSPAHGRLFSVRNLIHQQWLKRLKRREAAEA
ncbi:hypothetical protein [Arthrobacter burdickii]|uniref:Uncharacterized protein n=1 Tax=Arthrobacter burdickii TaxID=3035920 RepID=A0ABT8K4G4_9MICC|nr:hypothetical protein [Arthrobacter burdickii]MDN4611462.1 hypothetical protein [Arthrobacter burdickii]